MEQWQWTACGQIENRQHDWGPPSHSGCSATPAGNHIWVKI